MSVVFTRGSEWWLDRTTKQGRERYPRSIVVGPAHSKVVRYVPEKTCEMVEDEPCSCHCTNCGYDHQYPQMYWNFCPHCGAKVVSSNGQD